jgi:ectoine hydroxylase-related dioxygenase (phytanoyl-CoA dioxygenase family)
MTRTTTFLPSDAEVDAYARDGVVCLRGVLDAAWIEVLRAGAEKVRAAPGRIYHAYVDEPDGRIFFNTSREWPRIDELRRAVFESPAARIAAHLTRSAKANVLWDGLFYRTAGVEQSTPWHQDVPYWPVEGETICSLWFPLDPAPEESVLAFVPGSHRMGGFERLSFRDGGKGAHSEGERDDAIPMPDIDADPEGHGVKRWALAPGDCVAFAGYTLHGSPGNSAPDRPLRAVVLRYAGDDATYAVRPEGTSSSFTGHGLALDSDLFPVVWREGDAEAHPST